MIHETCVSGQFQCVDERALINVAAENNPYFNIVPMYIHDLACLASWLYAMDLRVTAKKQTISVLEVDNKTRGGERIKLSRLAA